MPAVVKHAWTHRARAEGGTDPVEGWLPYLAASNNAATQSVTDDTELVFSTNNGHVVTNSPGTFAFDTSDPSGIIIYRKGVYRLTASVYYNSLDVADPREMYATCQLLSAGPLAGLGASFGDGGYAQYGPGQSQSSLNTVTASNTISKSALYHMGIGQINASAAAPMRAAVVLVHLGTDYTVDGIASMLFIERIGGFGAQAPVPAV